MTDQATEAPQLAELVAAITKLRVVTFQRSADPPDTMRIGEPHLLFESATGELLLSYYQTEGHSNKGGLPAWRLAPVANITDVVVHETPFTIRPTFNPTHYRRPRLIAGEPPPK